MAQEKKNKKVDSILLGVVLILLVFGLIMISSAGIAISKDRFGDEYHLFRRQLFYGVIPGLVCLFVVQKIHYTFWKKIAVPLFVLATLFLVLIFIPGFGLRLQGASRWLSLGPISFQPTEFMKLAIIIYLASWIESKGRMIMDFKESFLPFIGILGVIGFLVIKQPDVGTLGAISIISLVMFFSSGAPIRFIWMLIGSGVGLLLVLIAAAPYRLNRLKAFADPTVDPQGIGYQINQALIAVGSGGILGLGFGQSRQKFNYLPEPVGDSIFAIISEELGMIGAVILLILFILFALRGFKIARNAPDKFAALVAVGVSSWIIFQAFINIAAIIGIIPLTGIPLPFVSYGATSLVFVLTAVGILLNISKFSKME